MRPILFLVTPLLLALLAPSVPAQLGLSIDQPGGAGHLRLQVSSAAPGAELFVLVSNAPHTPTGGGPFLGLSTTNSHLLLDQLLSPLGTDPHHVTADQRGDYLWELHWAPIGTTATFDVLAFEWARGGGIGATSPVVFASVDL